MARTATMRIRNPSGDGYIVIDADEYDPQLHIPWEVSPEATVERTTPDNPDDPDDPDDEPQLVDTDARIAEAAAMTVDQLRHWLSTLGVQDNAADLALDLALVRHVIDREDAKGIGARSMALAALRAKERLLEALVEEKAAELEDRAEEV